MYIQADRKTKEQALGKLHPVEGGLPRFKPDDALLLSCRRSDYAESSQDWAPDPLPLTGADSA